MKKQLIVVGVSAAGLATTLAIVSTLFFSASAEFHLYHQLTSLAFYVGLFSVMALFGAKASKD